MNTLKKLKPSISKQPKLVTTTSTAPKKTFDNFVDSFKKVELYRMVRKTPCGHHAWYESNYGLIRKPIQPL